MSSAAAPVRQPSWAVNGSRIGDNSMINAYLVEQAGEVTIVDAGVPGYFKDLDRELAAMGRTAVDIRALILTHGHSDHIGFAERLRRERRIPVSVHGADAALARGEVPNPAKGYGPVRLGPSSAIRQIRQAQKRSG